MRAFLIAVPVLLGALARIPMGLLTDRLGSRAVFTVPLYVVAVSSAVVPLPPSRSAARVHLVPLQLMVRLAVRIRGSASVTHT